MTVRHDQSEPMTRTDMVTLESALRRGWLIPDEKLQMDLRRVQAVRDHAKSNDRALWRAKRILELAKSRPVGRTITP